MPRRDRKSQAARAPQTTAGLAAAEPDGKFGPWLGERLRRIALGLTAALVAARVYWPSELGTETDTGSGLDWVLVLLLTVGLAVLALLIGGSTRMRWSWADAAVYVLVLLVGLSASRGAERRVAINLAWEWGALGIAYFLVRNLPRTRGESSALAGAVTAAAVAVSAYGLFQVAVEFPELHAAYLRNPVAVLQKVGIDPNGPSRKPFEDRLLGSNEPFATFALTNSLAGFLVGATVLALAVAFENLRSRAGRGSRAVALAAAAVPGLLLLSCLLLTKSRSAYLGLIVGLAVLAWHHRGQVSLRTLAMAGGGLAAVLALMVLFAASTRHLDIQVLTESTKSLRYRGEYWVGAWRMIANEPGAFWKGLGPGNFAGPYLRHKLPQASEEVSDPHNLVLEVWATAGLWAVLALLAALGWGLWETFGPPHPRGPRGPSAPPVAPEPAPAFGRGAKLKVDSSAPPTSPAWVIISAVSCWVVAMLLGRLNPFEAGMLARWLILGCVWPLAVCLGLPLWNRLPIPAAGVGAAVLAMAINLLAAGGIGIPSVALAFWTLLALGLNLRDDRPCSRVREVGRYGTAFSLAVVWAALVGTFAGSISPFWKAEAALAEAQTALRAKSPKYHERARDAFVRACELDRLSVSPWLALAEVEYQYWLSRGAKGNDPIWKMVALTFDKALAPPRNPNSLDVQRRRAVIAQDILTRSGSSLTLHDVLQLRAEVAKAYRIATRLYPTSAILHAEEAAASADLGMYDEAAKEAAEALRLDKLTPHTDKKLPAAVRSRIEDDLARWSKQPKPE